MGHTVPSDTKLVRYSPEFCVSTYTGVKPGDADAGAWIANYPTVETPDDFLQQSTPIPPFVILTDDQQRDGAVWLFWVWKPGIHTAQGIQVGSSRQSLTAAYPRFDQVLRGGLSDVYVVNGTSGALWFEVANPTFDGYWDGGQTNKVLWMGAVFDHQPAVAIAASSIGPYSCPSSE